jgi:hypothetical protein
VVTAVHAHNVPVVGRLTESDPAALVEGQTMRLVAEALDALTVWAFTPA